MFGKTKVDFKESISEMENVRNSEFTGAGASAYPQPRVHVEFIGKTERNVNGNRNSTRIRRMLRINTDFF